VTLLDFMRLFPEFRAASWSAWRAHLARLAPAVRELHVVAGRGSGKSRIVETLRCLSNGHQVSRWIVLDAGGDVVASATSEAVVLDGRAFAGAVSASVARSGNGSATSAASAGASRRRHAACPLASRRDTITRVLK